MSKLISLFRLIAVSSAALAINTPSFAQQSILQSNPQAGQYGQYTQGQYDRNGNWIAAAPNNNPAGSAYNPGTYNPGNYNNAALANTSNNQADETRRYFHSRVTQPVGQVRTTASSAPIAPVQAYPPNETNAAHQNLPVGDLRLKPYFQQDFRRTDNVNRTPEAETVSYSQSELGFKFNSGAGASQFKVDGHVVGAFEYGLAELVNAKGAINGELALELRPGVQLRLGGGFDYSNDMFPSNQLPEGALSRPNVRTLRASAELENSSDRALVILRGGIEQIGFERMVMADGTKKTFADYDGRILSAYGKTVLRTGGRFDPFVETELVFSNYEHENAQMGNVNSTLFRPRAGIALNGEKLNGEILAGLDTQEYSDSTQIGSSSTFVGGGLSWTPEERFEFKASASYGCDIKTMISGCDTVRRMLNMDVDFMASHRLTLMGGTNLTMTEKNGGGFETTTRRFFGNLRYALNKNVLLTGGIDYEQFEGVYMPENWSATTYSAGLRFEH